MPEEVTFQELLTQNRLLQAENERQSQEIKLLKEKIDLLIRRLFGAKSEKLDAAQLELLLKDLDSGKAAASAEKAEATPNFEALKSAARASAKKQRRERWPQDLAIEQEVIEPAEVRDNPEAFRCIGEEVTEMLDYRPAKFFRRQIIRRKFVRRDQAELAPLIAPLPESLQQRCIAAPGLLAQVIVSKYCDHQPLYRQEQIYWDRHRVWLPRQSMARWIQLASEWLKPIYRQIKEQMMKSSYIQVDETPIKYLDPGNGKTGQGYLWVVHRPGDDVLFEWYTTREAKCLDKLIPSNFSGTIQCDGYSAYDRFAKHRAIEGWPVLLAGCWAHARRGFYEALDHAPKEAGWVLIQIGHLYDIERTLRRQRAGPVLRDAYRTSQSAPICRRIQRVLQRWYITRRFLPRSTMGKAVSYTLGQWQSLEVYLKEPEIEIDNNLVENAIRPTALGKKNWLFFGDADAGQRSAIIYSIIQSCRRHDIEPYTYLRDVLSRLPTMTNRQIKDIVPKAWAAAIRNTAPRAA
ncbi:MAG TPA: IS66 family transposase [Acidobacteriaceae bacterium]